MKISLNWMRQFTNIDLAVDDLVAKIGAQLGAVEEVIDLGAKYKGIIVAKVVTCVDHPNADRLHVCTIDDGGVVEGVTRDERGYVQVVCGAPNVREGLRVAWLPPGSTVPASYDKDPFVLEARALRGVVSNGMLASSKELAIGDDHSGILEVDIDAAPGTAFADVYELNDYIIDIENKMFTHRPDCFGILGVAREVAGIQHVAFESPEWYRQSLGRITAGKRVLPLAVQNDLPDLVPRFCAITMSDVIVRPSPIIMQTYLARVGVRPISNIVDITNYLMVLTGQPLHAYDYDKVLAQDANATTATLVVRHPAKGEKITLLNGKTIEPRDEAIMIATKDKLIGVGGAMGGADTEVDDATKNIIVEVANFDMYSIRRTSMAHGLFTDAVTRFNKGQSPLQNDRVIDEAVAMVSAYGDAQVASELIDEQSAALQDMLKRQSVHEPVSVTVDFINERLGLTLTAADIAVLLENVECTVKVSDGTALLVHAPFWRTDIEIPEDVVEEVGRLYGYDQLPLDLPRRTITPAQRNELLDLKQRIRDCLAKAGANEVLTYSFVHGNLLDKVGQDKSKAFQLSNALSPDLQYYRLSLTPSLLERVHPNIKAGYDAFAIFELGKAHQVDAVVQSDDPIEDGLPAEFERLSFVYAAHDKVTSESAGAAYYQAKRLLTNLLDSLGVVGVRFTPITGDETDQAAVYYEPGRSATISIDDVIIGRIGEYKASVKKALKLPVTTAGFELGLTPLLPVVGKWQYAPLPRFPKIEQDICLKVAHDVTYQQVYDLVVIGLDESKPADTAVTVSPLDIYQRKDDITHKQITLRITIASHERTLTDAEVAALLDGVAEMADKALGAERV